ncbi:MAG: gamma-glutamyl-gamma-aminobutyrate hydrolase family protein [Bacteroidales bacterium]
MKKIPYGILVCFLIPFLFSFTPDKEKPFKVALTKASPNYINWITKGDSSIMIVDLNDLKPAEAIQKLHDCAALVLTGGGDIDPSLYKNAGNTEDCKDIDVNRDKLEKAMIDEALTLKMPILGICRGEQMLNVALGGSLITDIPSFKKLKKNLKNARNTVLEQPIAVDLINGKKEPAVVIHQCDDYLHCYHTVRLESTSLLRRIIGFDTGFVTTNHHQAILTLGNGLRKNAQSADSIIEGIEWNEPKGKSFMIGVQWHPERMDTSNAFSGKLLQRFLAEAKKYVSKLQNMK